MIRRAALIIAVPMALAASSGAEAARLVIEYACTHPATFQSLERARSLRTAALFQARLQHALATGRCRLAQVRPTARPVETPARPRRIVRLTKAYPLPPAVRAHEVETRPSHRPTTYAPRFPGPPLFEPVR